MGVWVILHLPHLKKPDKRACGYPTLVIRGNVAKLRQIFFFLNVLRGERKRKRREGLLCVPPPEASTSVADTAGALGGC